MKNKIFKSLEDVINFSIEFNGESTEFDCNFKLKVEGRQRNIYTVSICNRGILFYFKEGYVDAVVDTIGFNNYLNFITVDLES